MKKIALCFSFLFLFGCVNPSLEYDKEIFYIHSDIDLNHIEALSTIREWDGEMIVQVRGNSDTNQSVFYKIQWFDTNGIEITSTLSQWKKANLFDQADFTWKFFSPSKRANSYRIYITNDIGNGIIE